jgi:hypothetical protein
MQAAPQAARDIAPPDTVIRQVNSASVHRVPIKLDDWKRKEPSDRHQEYEVLRWVKSKQHQAVDYPWQRGQKAGVAFNGPRPVKARIN